MNRSKSDAHRARVGRIARLTIGVVVIGAVSALLTGCASSADPTLDVPALDRAPILDLLPAHSAINSALGKDLPYIQEPREIDHVSDVNQPSSGSACDLAEYTSGHPDSASAGQVIVGGKGNGNGIEVLRFPAVGSATRFMKTLQTLQDTCAPKQSSNITSWSAAAPGFTTWRDYGSPHAALQRGAVIVLVYSTKSESNATQLAKLTSDTLADFK
ncbi:MAG: hypothetical protein H7201_09780 [Candidatus Saccharibacteria bacterium]|nr:hypothetical protein [Microbacteriaceae bacterium]